ncbi:MAG: quinone-dependent dihydroorotate dehydrogenase [Ferruginibacter sp.]
MYSLIRQFLFLFDPERVHHFSMSVLRSLCQVGILEKLLRAWARPSASHPVNLWGISFRNPVGLAAGFDKNALYLKELDALGFGFTEIGTVTPIAQAGNDKPRLFRLPKDKALINRMGFNNDGMDAVAARLRAWKAHPLSQKPDRMIIGGNIGKNKQTPNEEAWRDYLKCFEALHDCVDYFVVNVSSPNTPGLRALQEKDSLRKIFSALQDKNQRLLKPRPLLLKIAPDLSPEQVDEIIELALEIGLDGLIISNTSISRDGLITGPEKVRAIGAGGLSGKPIREMSTGLLKHVAEKSELRISLIGSGGIFTAADARAKLESGARLVQVWTGFIYEGPFIVKKICQHI